MDESNILEYNKTNFKQSEKLHELICPFCRGTVRIIPCDDDGGLHFEPGYEDNPTMGLGYLILHEEQDVPLGKQCPIATPAECEEHLGGTTIYDSIEEIIELWNGKMN